jgi:hypothetical protein
MAGDHEDSVNRSDTGETVETIIEDIEVSLKARSKTARYLNAAAIKDRVAAVDGTLFRNASHTYYLKTSKTDLNQSPQPVIIVFTIEERTIHVVTQTTDHYDWSTFEHVQNPSWEVDRNR